METQVIAKSETKLTIRGGQGSTEVPVIKDAKARQLLALQGTHATLDKAVGFLDTLLTQIHSQRFVAKGQNDALLKLTHTSLTHSLHITEPIVLPVSYTGFYEAPSWMPVDSAMYAEYRLYVDTRWFKHATATLVSDRLMHVFGLHAATGEAAYWNATGAANVFLRELCAAFIHPYGAEPNAAVSVAAQSLESIVKLVINLAREENYGSLERVLPLLELVSEGVIPLGIRDDRHVLVAFA